MRTGDPNRPWIPDHPATRQHLITMLDQSLWLLQWAANTPTLTAEERRDVEQALRAVLEPQRLPEQSGNLATET